MQNEITRQEPDAGRPLGGVRAEVPGPAHLTGSEPAGSDTHPIGRGAASDSLLHSIARRPADGEPT